MLTYEPLPSLLGFSKPVRLVITDSITMSTIVTTPLTNTLLDGLFYTLTA